MVAIKWRLAHEEDDRGTGSQQANQCQQIGSEYRQTNKQRDKQERTNCRDHSGLIISGSGFIHLNRIYVTRNWSALEWAGRACLRATGRAHSGGHADQMRRRPNLPVRHAGAHWQGKHKEAHKLAQQTTCTPIETPDLSMVV